MALTSLWSELESDLERLKSRHLFRALQEFSHQSKAVDFSSNDYLNLSQHPKVIQSALLATKRWGTGSGASRSLSGNLKIHAELEKKIALFKKEQTATIFSSGYLANLGVLSSLANEKDLILMDRLNHASLFDGARLSKAKWQVYPHRNMAQLKKLLSRARLFRRKFVVTDAYFSMDGTVAPLDDLLGICERYGAILMVDEAHSTGVFGKSGRGLTEQFGLEGKIPVVMGTLSKALGSVGGFVVGRRALKETLVNFCRPFIYTTAPSPAASAASLRALQLVEKDSTLRKRLWENVKFLREALQTAGFKLMHSQGPIIPILIGDAAKTIALRDVLKKENFIVSAIRPPTVPKGTDRLRLSVSAAHTRLQLFSFMSAMKKIKDRV